MIENVPDIPVTAEGARAFLDWCCHVIGNGFHPDDSASGYINFMDGAPTFSAEGAVRYDRAMDKVFELVPDLYEYANNRLEKIDEERLA